MAIDFHRREASLFGSRFLASEDAGNIISKTNCSDRNGSTHKQSDFESASRSLSSQESEFTYSETETEEDDDYNAKLARQMAHYMLVDDDKDITDKSWGFTGNPNANFWSPLALNNGTREGSSLEISALIKNERTCDNITNGMVRKFETVNTNNKETEWPELGQFQTFCSQPNSTPIYSEKPSFGFHWNQTLSYEQMKTYKMKQDQVLKQKFQKKNEDHSGFVNGRGGARSFGYSSSTSMPWTKQQVSGSGMKAVFINGSGPTNGSLSSGTGVFLPCVIGNSSANTCKSQNKRGCSPVLIPAKVLQALKVHFDRMGHSTTGLTPNSDSSFPFKCDANNGERSDIHSQKKRQNQTVPAMKCNNETSLPQEWTY